MELEKYVGRDVKIIDCDNKIWIGRVKNIDFAFDHDDYEYDEIGLKAEGYSTTEFVFPENEIKSIEIINQATDES
ncbi:hypothetical protein FC52_GL000310 [Lactobacillus pasteurii DSM 23907 = CRBIP 24.76]|uniref:LSM domain protein n=1 Tax=Lactobacillus pasteurii DSM 23907 = CRBIP 24.76 TaxID=1423790 RepID=I7LB77_9LACO|nr:hypothetical protein [Lactobacillus pasteurii]KRK08612.1 hypothetical protein FC52_GL000310 [Lactobacillus pasteurii DSM 23907 = CRBIP 24.76]TDG76566.1 hypothetical protein C5L33_001325 [Lactobacillus pasteurii]CCI85341.1 Putative uncharacterized protein [Lactobacillus pasteurii DSM 23907 = CRBIP 24.76]